ncbi:MAG: hypothetical protein JXR76_08790 [Deltaproteobacteria bacterium]|nr:hypothetical protein [Deltaproteobacteria bacterium]
MQSGVVLQDSHFFGGIVFFKVCDATFRALPVAVGNMRHVFFLPETKSGQHVRAARTTGLAISSGGWPALLYIWQTQFIKFQIDGVGTPREFGALHVFAHVFNS